MSAKVTVDKEYFQNRIRELGLTQRAVADKLGVDPATLANMLKAQREWHLGRITAIATILNLDFLDVVEHLGFDVPAPTIAVTGVVGAQGEIAPTSGRNVARPLAAANATRAIRVQREGPFNGAVMFVDAPAPAITCLGLICVVSINGKQTVRRVARGSDDHLFDLAGVVDETGETDVELSTVAPVRWVKL